MVGRELPDGSKLVGLMLELGAVVGTTVGIEMLGA
jgi:hypothetical protein